MAMSSLPRKTFARKIVRMLGYTRETAIHEIVWVDDVNEEEAARRYDEALRQQDNRAAGQYRRHANAKRARERARFSILLRAGSPAGFMLPRDLRSISEMAGWGWVEGFHSTGRVFREWILPLVRNGILADIRDDDGRLIGYRLTDKGQSSLDDQIK